jgi:DNA-binding NarL/FixJ family response regulator
MKDSPPMPPPEGVIRQVLIVDDLPDALDMLDQAVRQAFGIVTVVRAEGVGAANRATQVTRFDLALVDLHLGDGHGGEVIAALVREQPECRVVVATIFDDDDHLFHALQAGAQGYLLKDRAPEWVGGQLRGIAQGHPPLSPAIARRLIRHFQPQPQPQSERTAVTTEMAPVTSTASLTPREREVLTLLAKGIHSGEIARLLGISRHTVGDHIKNLYRKLNISSRAEAALEARDRGLM